jgi:CRP-like cAMP-binding protein
LNPRTPHGPPHERLLAKLSTIADLTDEAKAAIAALPMRLRSFAENADLVRQGDMPNECVLIVDGFVCRYKLLGEGQRQIMSFHIPGDMPDLQSLHLKTMDHSLGALTPTVAAFIPHAAVHEVVRIYPEVASAFWRDTLIDAAVFREWLAGVGRRTAHQRIAHVICEVYVKIRSVGLADGPAFELPVTQAELADSLGLSSVHVNRVLQDLRREEMITYRGKYVVIVDWDRLRAAGDFDVGYLHLKDDALSWT